VDDAARAPADLPGLIEARAAGRLAEADVRGALVAAGFSDGRAACEALDALLADPREDLPVAELVLGSAASAEPLAGLINSSRLALLPDRPAAAVPASELATFLGASQHMADLLLARPELIAGLGTAFDAAGAPARYRAAGAGEDRERALRLEQQRDLLAIAWEDLVRGLDVEQVTQRLSLLADAITGAAAAGCGADRHFAIIALGKLGGMELNYSSDIDLIFVRPDSADDQPSADLAGRALLKLLSRQTPEGHLYRVDMRLRPEGQSGLLTRTMSSCMQYYAQVGRPWERQMLTKARLVCDSGGAGAEFLARTRDWILRCGMDAGAIRQFKRLKSVTEAHHSSPEETADIKQAPGGIRDIETIVQFLSLLHAAQQPGLLSRSTLAGLERLRVAGALTTLEASRLRTAYRFHRRVENLLQVMHRVQTHRLPGERLPLARLMHRRDVQSLDMELAEHRSRVREIFERHFQRAFRDMEGPAADLAEVVLDARLPPGRSHAVLGDLGFQRPAESLAMLRRAAAPASRFLPASPRLLSAFASVAPALLERLALAPDPDAALDRFERMTAGVGAREVLYSQLGHEPRLLAMLCDLAAGSPYLTELLISEPHIFDDFIDALLTGMRGRNARREQLAGRRDHLAGRREHPAAGRGQPAGRQHLTGLHREGREDGEDPWLLLSDYKKLETLRIGVHDLQDLTPIRQTLAELSQLCIDILRRGFDVCLARAVREHGSPFCIKGLSARVSAGMVVLALGKVGGLEANYASDADVLFVYSGEGQTDTGIPNSVFFAKIAEEFIARVAGARGGPRLYRLDTRLRPEGAKGPLVTSLRALQAYYRSPRAALFERQALLKARVVAGDAELGQQVLSVVRATVRGPQLPDDLAARLRDMRARIEATAHGHDLKRGTGGMVDIEFLVQYLQLRHGGRSPSIIVQETPRALEALGDAGVLPVESAHWLRDTYLFFRRVETRLQIALGLDTKEIPAEREPCRALALRLGYVDSAEGDAGHQLLVDLESAAQQTRERYDALLV
jgi:[glutamine synthetase] adenylyltransferase / [glutamine synthetase]-adenylyl-L-tyrosine phosphorylase